MLLQNNRVDAILPKLRYIIDETLKVIDHAIFEPHLHYFLLLGQKVISHEKLFLQKQILAAYIFFQFQVTLSKTPIYENLLINLLRKTTRF